MSFSEIFIYVLFISNLQCQQTQMNRHPESGFLMPQQDKSPTPLNSLYFIKSPIFGHRSPSGLLGLMILNKTGHFFSKSMLSFSIAIFQVGLPSMSPVVLLSC
jgi:hypothetical protein